MLFIVTALLPVFCSVTWLDPRCSRWRLPKLMLVGVTVSVAPPAAAVTVSVNDCVAALPTPFAAAKLMANVPLEAGVPLSVPVPLWLSMKETPPGNAPVSVRPGIGNPVAVTVNEPSVPVVNAALLALVTAGA